MSTQIALSPILNPHQSILRRRHIIDGQCRTVPYQQKRRQSLAAMQSNTRHLPPTPCKSTFALRKSAYTGKRRTSKIKNKQYAQIQNGQRSRTPSPNKKRKLSHYPTLPPAKPIDRNQKHLFNPEKLNDPQQKAKLFKNLGLVGAGSFSQVYKVQNALDKKIYAIKKNKNHLNTREAVSQALHEVDIVKSLQYETSRNHQNSSKKCKSSDREQKDEEKEIENKHIVKFRDFWISHQRQLHQIYDYYEHGTLFDVIEHNNRLNYLQILQIIEQICNGLQFIHSLNIIHIDLKPSNIFFTKDYILKLGDFGISVNLNEDKSFQYRFSGDPIYIAPELMNFNRTITDINTKTDIFSLGIILLELLCDIKAPSQGQIFQNLRQNVIDFNIMEPSPIKSTKFRRNSSKHIGFAFADTINHKNTDNDEDNDIDLDEIGTNISLNTDDMDIINDIDRDIKTLCIKMLQRDPKQRPDSKEIIAEIHKIVNNKRYKKHFTTCKSLTSLSLPPTEIINSENTLKKSISANSNNGSGYNSHNISHCNSNNQSTCNSGRKQQEHIVSGDSFGELQLQYDGDTEQDGINWFYQASPRCYDSLFQHKEFSSSLSPIPAIINRDEFQLNLNSAFEDAEEGGQSPCIFSSASKSKRDGNIFNFDDIIIHEHDEEEEEEVIFNAEEQEEQDLDSDDCEPKSLTFSFM